MQKLKNIKMTNASISIEVLSDKSDNYLLP